MQLQMHKYPPIKWLVQYFPYTMSPIFDNQFPFPLHNVEFLYKKSVHPSTLRACSRLKGEAPAAFRIETPRRRCRHISRTWHEITNFVSAQNMTKFGDFLCDSVQSDSSRDRDEEPIEADEERTQDMLLLLQPISNRHPPRNEPQRLFTSKLEIWPFLAVIPFYSPSKLMLHGKVQRTLYLRCYWMSTV